MSFLGIDLSASAKRGSFFAHLDGQGHLTRVDSFNTFEELADVLQVHKPQLVAIDAPLSLPLGLCCLEESHSCSPALGQKGRACEQELARMHIGCFFTTKRSIIKGLIYRGLELSQDLRSKGYQVIEVYPYATKVLLFGDNIPPKNSARGLAFLKEKLSHVINGLGPYVPGLNHDGCDALLAAHTAWLHGDGRTDSLGLPEEGYIVVPKLLSRVLS
jgi:predicted nuclease with RNAse H fold